ncbi:MAG: hypothetical protein R3C68_09635 [Myxococcota bacterium]
MAIGDRTAVEPLIDLTKRKDAGFVLQIVALALAERNAEGFLVTLASGHPSEDVQRGAKDALDELRRRSGADPSAAK